MRQRRAAVLAVVFLIAACGGNDPRAADTTPTGSPSTTSRSSTTSSSLAATTTVPVTTTTTTVPVEPIAWTPYLADPTMQEGWVEVPIDRADPGSGTFRLHVVRRPANDAAHRIGSLFVNPGGPGGPGIWLAERATEMYSTALLDRFDIVAWDPRGTGTSTPAIDCVTDLDHFTTGTDITPDTPQERQQLIDLAREFATACAAKNADIIQHIGTNDSAQDLDAIRRAIGEDRISFFGWSYGSTLGAVWATMFPATVRAAVFDGAPDPTLGFTAADLTQSAGFEHTLTTFLEWCSTDATCAFHTDGHADTAFDALMQTLDETPIPTVDGRPALTRSMALTAVAMAMYDRTWWVNLAGALAEAQQGMGGWLLAFSDRYYQRNDDGTFTDMQEAFQTITCMDATDRPDVATADETSSHFREVAPRSRPGTTGDYFCSFFPTAEHPRVAVTGIGAGPVLVVGNTNDPATPLVGAQAMAGALEEGVLLEVVADGHTAYGINDCAKTTIDAYLVDLTVPADGTRCA